MAAIAASPIAVRSVIGNDYPPVRLRPGRAGGNAFDILQRRVDNVPLIGIHRLQRHASFILQNFCRHFLGKLDQGFFALCPVVFCIHGNMDMSIAVLVHYVIRQMLDRIKIFPPGVR